MPLPNENRENVIIGPTEPIVSPVINRGLSRLHQNDQYLEQFTGSVRVDAEDDGDICYLEDKIIAGPGVSITEGIFTCGKGLLITATTSGAVPSGELSGVLRNGSTVAGNLVEWQNTLGAGTSGYVVDSEISVSQLQADQAALSAHIADTNNPHDTTLDDLSGVDLTGAVSGDALIYDGTNWGPGKLSTYQETVTAGGPFVAFSNPVASFTVPAGTLVNDNRDAVKIEFYGDRPQGSSTQCTISDGVGSVTVGQLASGTATTRHIVTTEFFITRINNTTVRVVAFWTNSASFVGNFSFPHQAAATWTTGIDLDNSDLNITLSYSGGYPSHVRITSN